jgi:hypothetical protein
MRIKIITICFLVLLTVSNIPRADALIRLFPDASGQQAACRGGRDWGTFISSIIVYDDFVEYWNDILVRYNANLCHYMDIDSLLNRLKAVRSQLRQAFYVCADITRMKKTYYELEAELYYARKFIKYTKTAEDNYVVVNDKKVLNDMKAYFVDDKEFFTQDELQVLFDRFKVRYQSKLESYNNCVDPGWQSLIDKWNEFKATAGGIGPALQQAQASAEKKWDKMANTSMNMNRDFWGGFLDVKINGLEPKEAFAQIAAEFKRNMPGGSTIGQLQAANQNNNAAYAEEVGEAEYMAEYEMLYKESTGEYVKLLMARLNLLDDIIKSTFPYQNQTIQCVANINNKQC